MIFNFLISGTAIRPSILEADKGEHYHCEFARWCIGDANNNLHQKFIEKINKNKRFYKGDQWVEEEDTESFLKDDNNQERNRLAIVQNQIRPMVEQYRGNAIRMNINFRAKSMSPQAINRRETSLAKNMHMSRLAQNPDNPFGEALKEKFPIGDTEAETRGMFENSYQDDYVKNINYLMSFVSNRNKFVNKQITVAMQLALGGLAVIKSFEHAGHQEFTVVQSDNFFFDRGALESDLSDGEYMGEVPEMTPTQIFEMWQHISKEDREAIVNYAKFYSGNSGRINEMNGKMYNGKVPVFIAFWKDGQTDEYGYVKDEYGYEYLTKINYTYEGEDKPRYTDADLVKSKSIKARKLMQNDLKRKLYYDVLRFCAFIPREILGSVKTNPQENEFHDVVLDWGIVPYQETENQEYISVAFPYKCQTWSYIDGEILSPLDDAIDPQRFINRIWSIAENQINNSRGSGMVYDADALGEGGEAELLSAVNQSKPVKLNMRGKGVQNAVGSYDATIKNGTLTIFNIIDVMKASLKEVTGINDALKGESTGSDQLVGVTKLMIERGSLMQEPFYYAITNLFEQCFQSICKQGKRIYADNERNIAIAVGDEGMKVIKISGDMRLEDFRAEVTRENADEILVGAANEMLLMLLNNPSGPLIDQKRFAGLWGRSTPAEVSVAMRAYANEKEEIQRRAQKEQDKEEKILTENANIEQQQAAEQQDEMTAREDVKDMTDKRYNMAIENTKALGKIAPKNRKAETLILKNAQNFGVNQI